MAKMRADIRNLVKEERGVSVVIGAMLMMLVVAAIWGTIQAYHVPNWNEDVEYEHLNIVHDDMIRFKSDVEDVALLEAPKSSDFHMGLRYPNRMFLANPGAGVAGSLTSEGMAISIEYTIDGLSNPTITTGYISNRIIYEVQGRIDSPKLVYEHGVIIRDYGNEYATTDEQSLIIGDEIYIPVLTGNLTASSSMETESIDIKPMSRSYSRTRIQSANITLSTDYPEVWEQLLAGTSTADTTVHVDIDEGEINIISRAVELISFPVGDVTSDALYAGLIVLRTEPESVTYTSIDTSQVDYPRILDISIVSSEDDERINSTITATVQYVTAPYDIHADLTAFGDPAAFDPELYDVFPNVSPTPWVASAQNNVSWVITHPAYSAGIDISVSFWVINTDNNMQFFTSRVFSRLDNKNNKENWYQ
jgi:FlaG/FlaF family flagellin (archaellin)